MLLSLKITVNNSLSLLRKLIIGTTKSWINGNELAYVDSSSASNIDKIITGSYVGNAPSTSQSLISQYISLSFTPKVLIVYCAVSGIGFKEPGGAQNVYGGIVDDSVKTIYADYNEIDYPVISIGSNGFSIYTRYNVDGLPGCQANSSGLSYIYIAFG